MVRLIVVLALVGIASALVVALLRDRGERRDEAMDRLRWSFLHGRPLGGRPSSAALTEFAHPSGLSVRLPGSWKVQADGAALPPAGPSRVVELEVLRPDASAGGIDRVATALRGLRIDGERAVETLAGGDIVMKAVEPSGEAKAVTAVYTWWLGHARTDGGIDIAVFRMRVPVEAAPEVIVQSDLAVLDREVRAATFSG
jgi:hypothetical protein